LGNISAVVSRWPVAGPSGRMLTPSEQSGIERERERERKRSGDTR
jgi:hypothetical protein